MIKKQSQLLQEREAKRLAKRVAKKKDYQDGYRVRKAKLGLVRYEVEVPRETKDALEEMADLLSDEMDDTVSYRQRVVLAKRQLFVDGVARNIQAFTVLQERIDALEAEIAQLSPSLLPSTHTDTSALPEAIQRLPDTPEPLKQLLAQFYKRAIGAERNVKECDERAARYLELYEVQSNENQRLRKQIKTGGGYADTLVDDESEEGAFV